MPSTRAAGRRWALGDALVVAQLALTMVLLVVAGLLVRSLSASLSADVGFRTAGPAMGSADTNMVRYEQSGQSSSGPRRSSVRGRFPASTLPLVSPRLPFDVNFNQTSIRIDGGAYGPTIAAR